MGMDIIADIKRRSGDVIAEPDGFVIGFCHGLAHLPQTAVEVPAKTCTEGYTTVADFVTEGDSEHMGAVVIACDSFVAVYTGGFGIIAGIHIVEAYTGTELEMITVHGRQRGGEGRTHRKTVGNCGWRRLVEVPCLNHSVEIATGTDIEVYAFRGVRRVVEPVGRFLVG